MAAVAIAPPETILDVEDLRTHFLTPRGRVRAVDGVNLTLKRGTTLGLVGESGSGKTIFSRSVMNLLPKENVRRTGRISFMGRELIGLDDNEMRKLCGPDLAMVFQDPMSSLNPVMTIGKQITEGLRRHLKLNRSGAHDTAVTLLRSVNIPEAERRFHEYPHQLSGGMRQRVMIALALACGPRLLFADEPTTALDVTVQADILNLLQDQQTERFMTMVLVTHDLGVVAGRTDEIAVMYAGRIVEQAPTTVLFSSMRHPYSEALLRSIPKIEDPSHTRLRVITGRPPDLVAPPPGCKFAPRCPYAQPQCEIDEPTLQEASSTGHRFACHLPLGTPENAAALQSNLDKGRPQALAMLDSSASS
ncbi:ABC transporter ATP-binding protein [Desertimonas flava]|jgi:peptide/nickel transport system ATP-binding protein|uniref:ABC transporter ATP-binding protein n=1 Tax=Desertimonas flava TaxID=2064846 RepID=UPI000E34B52A|nr:ABC transporter ATP-binding protein [Desertimonas flava]